MQVWDTGIGIAPEHLTTIFDEYFQVANPERDKTKGLGLGLAIAGRLAKLLNTEIVCHSRLGKGSVFEFRLPLAPSRR
jgi:signal transduction histidine kinase